MEKTHGWKYERVKGNSKKTAGRGSASATPQTPQMPTPSSFAASVPTPMTDTSSPGNQFMGWPAADQTMNANTHQAISYTGGHTTEPIMFDGNLGGLEPVMDPTSAMDVAPPGSDYLFQHFGASPMFDAPQGNPSYPEYLPPTLPTGMDPEMSVEPMQEMSVEPIRWEELEDLDEQPNGQLMTPNASADRRLYGDYYNSAAVGAQTSANPSTGGQLPNLSPNGQANLMFTSPMPELYEDINEALPALGQPTRDFTLYSSNETSSNGSGAVDPGFFPSMPSMEQQYEQSQPYGEMVDLDLDGMM